jgi:hypothetical protein
MLATQPSRANADAAMPNMDADASLSTFFATPICLSCRYATACQAPCPAFPVWCHNVWEGCLSCVHLHRRYGPAEVLCSVQLYNAAPPGEATPVQLYCQPLKVSMMSVLRPPPPPAPLGAPPSAAEFFRQWSGLPARTELSGAVRFTLLLGMSGRCARSLPAVVGPACEDQVRNIRHFDGACPAGPCFGPMGPCFGFACKSAVKYVIVLRSFSGACIDSWQPPG